MSKLFIRIFLWFWLAMIVIGVILVTLALTTSPMESFARKETKRLTGYGQRLIETYEKGGDQALSEKILEYQKKEHINLVLLNVKTESLSHQPVQPNLLRFARKALLGQLPIAQLDEPGRRRHKDLRNFAIPLDQDYVLLAEVPRPSRLELLLDPQALTLRLVAIFLVATSVCYFLAHSLTAPIMKLRRATQELAGGDLGVRVAPQLGRKGGELADLGRDFDRMADRIANLIESRQRLLRDISHELRSPLARLNIALELARRKTGEGAAGALDRIGLEAERLNEMIGQLLRITRLESGTAVSREEVDLAQLLAQVVADANYEAQTRKRRARLTIHQGIVVNGSRELLHRALENVIRNGLWYTAEDTEVEVALRLDDGGEAAEITVRDLGAGVPRDALEKLFRPFYRVEESRDRQSGGAGVGLAIAEQAIHLHGGTIEAANGEPAGLVVTIRLPLTDTTEGDVESA
jgi:two-component system sensor histidine kinase CpxA